MIPKIADAGNTWSTIQIRNANSKRLIPKPNPVHIMVSMLIFNNLANDSLTGHQS